jgi:hypothetical protein
MPCASFSPGLHKRNTKAPSITPEAFSFRERVLPPPTQNSGSAHTLGAHALSLGSHVKGPTSRPSQGFPDHRRQFCGFPRYSSPLAIG